MSNFYKQSNVGNEENQKGRKQGCCVSLSTMDFCTGVFVEVELNPRAAIVVLDVVESPSWHVVPAEGDRHRPPRSGAHCTRHHEQHNRQRQSPRLTAITHFPLRQQQQKTMETKNGQDKSNRETDFHNKNRRTRRSITRARREERESAHCKRGIEWKERRKEGTIWGGRGWERGLSREGIWIPSSGRKNYSMKELLRTKWKK